MWPPVAACGCTPVPSQGPLMPCAPHDAGTYGQVAVDAAGGEEMQGGTAT